MKLHDFEVAGTDFTAVLEEGQFELNPASVLALPLSLVCGMSRASYEFVEQKQALLDALSPFQIVSKMWSITATASMLERVPDTDHIVYVGSWFGQQSAIACRHIPNYGEFVITCVDKDPAATHVGRYLLKCDSYHRRNLPDFVTKDIFEMSFEANTLFVWNGLEHFDANEVEKFLERHTECSFIFQSTSMEAADHTNLAHDVEDLLNVLPAAWDDGIVYRGEIECDLGSRYMMCVHGPGVELSPDEPDGDYFENDGLDRNR